MIQGLVAEEFRSRPVPATVSQNWRPVIHPQLRVALGALEDLINSKTARERDYQRLFATYPQLLFLLGNYDDVQSGITVRLSHVLCPEASTNDYVPDFFLHDSVTDLWDVLEIKPPFIQGPLFVGRGRNAHHALGPGAVLRRALSQLSVYGKALRQSNAVNYLRVNHDMRILRPRLILLIGLSDGIPTLSEFSKSQLLRSVSESADIFTYDQILGMARDKYR